MTKLKLTGKSNILKKTSSSINKKDFLLAVKEAAECPEDSCGVGGEPKKYVALLSHTGTSDPVAIILENTLGETPVWSRDNVGQYRMTAVNEIFTTNKTISFIGHNYDTPRAIWQFGRADGKGPDTNRVIWLQVYDSSGSSIDISSGGSQYYDVYVEVRVYP